MHHPNNLLPLFLRCLNADYTHTTAGGDYAMEWEPSHRHLYVMFEWSDGREDWHHNLTFSAKKVNPNAPKSEQWRVHRGFLKVWNAMQENVIGEINEINHQGDIRAITCVGYSHGAALSLLATETLSYRFGQTIHVGGCGFGSPRVVWGDLPDAVRQRLSDFHTIRNIPDLVTHLPPAVLGFHHVNLASIGQKGKYGPIEAHTSQAYINELSQTQRYLSETSSTRSAVALTNTSKASSDRWVFRSTYPSTPRR